MKKKNDASYREKKRRTKINEERILFEISQVWSGERKKNFPFQFSFSSVRLPWDEVLEVKKKERNDVKLL